MLLLRKNVSHTKKPCLKKNGFYVSELSTIRSLYNLKARVELQVGAVAGQLRGSISASHYVEDVNELDSFTVLYTIKPTANLLLTAKIYKRITG